MEHKEYPEERELVLCTVRDIQGTTVFANLDKYGKTGVIHTSEIAPGRIRNIRDYVVPNKKIVCQVLRIDERKGHIDLSLRRVSKKDTQEELAKHSKDLVASKILDIVLKDKSGSVKKKISEGSEHIFEFLEKSLSDSKMLEQLMSKDDAKKILEIVAEKIKPKDISVKAELRITTTDPEGVSTIKNALDIEKEGLKITYIGAPKYSLTLKGKDYKVANKELAAIVEKITADLKKKAVKVETAMS